MIHAQSQNYFCVKKLMYFDNHKFISINIIHKLNNFQGFFSKIIYLLYNCDKNTKDERRGDLLFL